MDFLAVMMSMLSYFAWGYLVSPSNRSRRFDVPGPEVQDPMVEGLPRGHAHHGQTSPTPGCVDRPATPDATASAADPAGWTSLDEYQLNRLLKESSPS